MKVLKIVSYIILVVSLAVLMTGALLPSAPVVQADALGQYCQNSGTNGGCGSESGNSGPIIGNPKNQGHYAGSCDELSSDISAGGFVRETLCPPGSSGNAIQVIVQNLSNYILSLATIILTIMISVGFLQVMTAGGSPEGLKAGKRRIVLAVSSIALFASGRLILGLIGVTSGTFLGVDIQGGFAKKTVFDIIMAVVNYIQFTAGALAVFMVIFGGIQMVTATGNPQKIQGARKTITYGLIGFLGVLAAGLIFNIVKQILGAS